MQTMRSDRETERERDGEIISVSTPYYVTSLVYELETIWFRVKSSVCLVLMIVNLFVFMGPLRIVCQISKQCGGLVFEFRGEAHFQG